MELPLPILRYPSHESCWPLYQGRPNLHIFEGGDPLSPQKCAKNSKGPPLQIFCTNPRRGPPSPPRILCKICTDLGGGEGGGRGALSRKLPTIQSWSHSATMVLCYYVTLQLLSLVTFIRVDSAITMTAITRTVTMTGNFQVMSLLLPPLNCAVFSRTPCSHPGGV